MASICSLNVSLPHEPRGKAKSAKLCVMEGVREYGDGQAVELWLDGGTGRAVIRALNEGGYACTDIDFVDMLDWLAARVPGAVDLNVIASAFVVRDDSE
jgi:hypothetical protein